MSSSVTGRRVVLPFPRKSDEVLPTRTPPTSLRLQAVPVDEPLTVYVGAVWSLSEILAELRELKRQGLSPRLTAVVQLPESLSEEVAAEVPAMVAGLGDRVVLTTGNCYGAAWRAVVRARLQSDGRLRGAVLTEPDAAYAVITAMQWLRAGDAFVVLWPSAAEATALVGRGAQWRASWAAPDAERLRSPSSTTTVGH